MRDENSPVLVGVAQLIQRDVDFEEALEPIVMLERIARECGDDCGAGERALREIDTIGLVGVVIWAPQNGPRMLADRIGARPSRELVTEVGGEVPVTLLNDMAQHIVDGDSQVALLIGCNNFKTVKRAYKAGVDLGWTTGGTGRPESFGLPSRGNTDREAGYGLDSPPFVYPIFENALRVRRGLDLDEHRAGMGALMSPFTEVAAANPYAWFPIARSATELTTPTAQNRMVGYPYTKYLNAVLETDQAAGVLMMSAAKAKSLGVPEEKWVYWHGGANAEEEAWNPSERPDHAACPALKATGTTALERSDVELAAIDHIDFYSCFPVAVSMACEMLGLAENDPRGLTVTGGLPYAGGPGNNYPTHSLAAMVETLRNGSGGNALVTGNGWYLTKHAATVLGTSPRESEFAAGSGDAIQTDAHGAERSPVKVVDEASGAATVLTYTACFGRDNQPERGVIIGETDSGDRFIANTPSDRGLIEHMLETEMIGTAGRVSHREGKNVFEPA